MVSVPRHRCCRLPSLQDLVMRPFTESIKEGAPSPRKFDLIVLHQNLVPFLKYFQDTSSYQGITVIPRYPPRIPHSQHVFPSWPSCATRASPPPLASRARMSWTRRTERPPSWTARPSRPTFARTSWASSTPLRRCCCPTSRGTTRTAVSVRSCTSSMSAMMPRLMR